MRRLLDWWEALVPVWLLVAAVFFSVWGNPDQRAFARLAAAAFACTLVGVLLIALLGVI